MSQGLTQTILAVFASSGVTAIIAGLFVRNKTKAESENISAEAAQVIREAAAGMVEDYRKDNALLRARLTDTDLEQRKTQEQNEETQRQLRQQREQNEETQRQLRQVTRQLEAVVDVLSEAIKLLRDQNVDVSRILNRPEIMSLLRLPD